MNNTDSLELSDAGNSLQAQGGQIILLTGAAGSGKSIWLKRMAGLCKLPAGMRIAKQHSVRMLFDRWPYIWLGQSVSQELLFGLKQQPEHKRLLTALSAWGLSDLSLESATQTLNRLQSVRLSLAAMSLAQAELILLDNPTAALAEEDANILIQEIAVWAKASDTIIVVACNRWQDWRSAATHIWCVSNPDQLPRLKIPQARGQA